MKSEINTDIYHANIILSLQYLLTHGEDQAKNISFFLIRCINGAAENDWFA